MLEPKTSMSASKRVFKKGNGTYAKSSLFHQMPDKLANQMMMRISRVRWILSIEVTTHSLVHKKNEGLLYPVLESSQDEPPSNALPALVLMSPRVNVLDLPKPFVFEKQLVGPSTVPVLIARVTTKPELKEAPDDKGFAFSELHNSSLRDQSTNSLPQIPPPPPLVWQWY